MASENGKYEIYLVGGQYHGEVLRVDEEQLEATHFNLPEIATLIQSYEYFQSPESAILKRRIQEYVNTRYDASIAGTVRRVFVCIRT